MSIAHNSLHLKIIREAFSEKKSFKLQVRKIVRIKIVFIWSGKANAFCISGATEIRLFWLEFIG